jgi:hypothetical protein
VEAPGSNPHHDPTLYNECRPHLNLDHLDRHNGICEYDNGINPRAGPSAGEPNWREKA